MSSTDTKPTDQEVLDAVAALIESGFGEGSSSRPFTFCVAGTGTGSQVIRCRFDFDVALVGFQSNGAQCIISNDGRTSIPTGSLGGVGGGMAGYTIATTPVTGIRHFFPAGSDVCVFFSSAVTVVLWFEKVTSLT